jgi:hypothetical protein
VRLLATITDSLDPGFGRIAALDLERGHAEVVFEWLPPPELRTSGKGFLGIAWLGTPGRSQLLACAHGALCRIDPTAWTLTGILHQPCMNDLHHATVHRDRLLVTNTGLDRIEAFDISGRFLGGWDLSPAWIAAERQRGCNPSREAWQNALDRGWELRSSALKDEPLLQQRSSAAPSMLSYDLDRTSASVRFCTRKTRHFVQPSHIAMLGDRPLVTRFVDRSIQDLADWSFPVPLTPGHPHDGEIHGERFWITCTTGLIVAYAIENGRLTSREVERIDIPECTGHRGWCRGLIVTEELIVVGLTAVQYIPPFGWSDPDIEGTETSVVSFDRRTLKLVARIDLQGFGGLPKLFGFVEWPSVQTVS